MPQLKTPHRGGNNPNVSGGSAHRAELSGDPTVASYGKSNATHRVALTRHTVASCSTNDAPHRGASNPDPTLARCPAQAALALEGTFAEAGRPAADNPDIVRVNASDGGNSAAYLAALPWLG